IKGNTTGVESWGTYRASSRWRLSAGLVVLDQDLRLRAGATDVSEASLGNDPSHWWTLRSSVDVSERQHFDVMVRRVGAVKVLAVPAYTAVDARYGWEATPTLEVGLVLRNLFDAKHAEWNAAGTRVEHERSALLQFIWRL